MNQGRIWCVVNPTVGLPLFLGGVAAVSLIVHASVMTHTSWMSNYWQGAAKTKMSENNVNGAAPAVAMAPQGSGAFSLTVSPVAATNGSGATSFVVTVAPQSAEQTAAASVPKRTEGYLALARPAQQ